MNPKKIIFNIKNDFFQGRDFCIHRLLICALYVLIASIFGYLLLIIVFSIPVEAIEPNVIKSAYTVNNEGLYPIISKCCTSTLDNYTDSFMLLESSNKSNESIFSQSIMVYRGITNFDNAASALVEHYIKDVNYIEEHSYARYWHGYLIFLKPLLLLFDYEQIRTLNMALQLFLLLIICYLFVKKHLKRYIVPYILSYFLLMPIAISKCLQFSSCYYIFSIGAIVILALPKDIVQKYAWFIFLNIGIATSYFDYLSYPLSTIGIPVSIYLAVFSNDKNKTKRIVANIFIWAFGYASMWISKWILTMLFTNYNIVRDVLGAIWNRGINFTFDGKQRYSIVDCLFINYTSFCNTPIIWLTFIYVFAILFAKRKHNNFIKINSYIYIILLPIVWYMFFIPHSSSHYFFTNKTCVVSAIAFLFSIAEC